MRPQLRSRLRLPTAALALVASGLACATPPSTRAEPASTPPCCVAEGREVARMHRVTALAGRRFTHAQLWTALDGIAHGATTVRVTEIGRSAQGRPIRAVTFGDGPVAVLLWSQMHGDESTATMSLADLAAWMAHPDPVHAALRRRLASALTVVMVPMLNPDGAELFQRENAYGVDVNRDARRLATPEARALKALRDSIRPAFGFNLHDQSARILAGPGGAQVGIALLAPAADSSRAYGAVRSTARLVAAEVAAVVQQEIPGKVAKYDDEFEPRAFGDLMQRWGTSTVLIESGALAGDPEKQRLRAVNVVAILSALDAIATRRHLAADARVYESLPVNTRAAADVAVLGGTLVLPGTEPVRADLTLIYEEAVAKLRPRVREVGDLPFATALDTVDAGGLYVHPDSTSLTGRGGAWWLRVDSPVILTIRRGASPASEVVLVIGR